MPSIPGICTSSSKTSTRWSRILAPGGGHGVDELARSYGSAIQAFLRADPDAKEIRTEYGTVSKQSIGAIQRRLLVLEEQGAESFFGEPALDIPQADALSCAESHRRRRHEADRLANRRAIKSLEDAFKRR